MINNIVSINGNNFAELITAVLAKGADFRFQAKGSSMSPFIKDKDIIIVTPVSSKNMPKVGRVAVFRNKFSQNITVHRIVFKKKDCFLMKGDNLKGYDGFFHFNHILGIVSSVERNNKKIWFGGNIIAFFSLLKFLNCILFFLRFFKKRVCLKFLSII